MFRITKIDQGPSQVTLKLEGRIASDWASLLEEECLRSLQENRKVLLDFSGVTYVDQRGVEALTMLAAKNIGCINCTAFIQDLLKVGGGNQ